MVQRISQQGSAPRSQASAEVASPSEYLKLKYTAPTDACKCGDCQLVPPAMLATWASEISAMRAALVKAINAHGALVKALEKVRSYNVDIAAGRINYRPHDHIQVIDQALAALTPTNL